MLVSRRAALAVLPSLVLASSSPLARAAAEPPSPVHEPNPTCSLLGLPQGTADESGAPPAARLFYDGPGPFLALALPRLEHTCAPCFPASCVGDRCLQSIYITYPRPLARRRAQAAAAAAAAAAGGGARAPEGGGSPPALRRALDPLGAPYPLAVISGGFLLGSDGYASMATRLATWGYVAVRYDRRDGLTDLLDDAACAELLADLVAWCARDPLLRRLADPSRTLLVGHSRGCKVGALAALRLQEEEAREQRAAAGEEEAAAAAGRRRAAAVAAVAALAVAAAAGVAPDGPKCAAEDALDARNEAAEAAALQQPQPPQRQQQQQQRERPRVVGMVCLDPVDATRYAPESPRYPSALAAMRRRAAEEAEGEGEEEGAQAAGAGAGAGAGARSRGRISDIPWAILGAAAGGDCAPGGSNYLAWFEGVPGPAVEVVIPGAGHMAFTDPPARDGGRGGGAAGGGGGGGGSGGGLARSVCSVGTADEAEVRRVSMALTVAFAEGVMRRGRGGVLAALEEQRCGDDAADAASDAAPDDGGSGGFRRPAAAKPQQGGGAAGARAGDDDGAGDGAPRLRAARRSVERTLSHLLVNSPSKEGGGPPLRLRTRWRGFPSASSISSADGSQ